MSGGVVAAGHALVAEAAADALRRGGNAFDAAIAGMAMATVAEPVLASLGGGGFLMARLQNGETRLYDFFVETPLKRRRHGEAVLAIHADFGPAQQEFHIGLGSSATPGMVPGLFALHEDLARLPIGLLFAPAIAAAGDGFPVTAFQAFLLRVIEPIVTASHGAARLFAPQGTLLQEGDLFRNRGLAETFERLASDGPQLFVTGEVGRAIAEQAQELGGHLTKEDLALYRVQRREPLHRSYRGAQLALNPPPSAGGTLIAYSLALLEAMDGSAGADRLCRALRETNRARAAHGEALADELSRPDLQQELRAVLEAPPAYRGTTHLSVVDREGNAAAASLSNGEGNGHLLEPHGFMLNNMLGEEDLNPQGIGNWPEGVRLSSMMAPTVIEMQDCGLVALGTGGSNRIRTAIVQVALGLIDKGMSLEEAIRAPRLHLEKCGTLSYEPGIAGIEAAMAEAESVRAFPAPNLFFGGVHAARRGPDGTLDGAGDPRRGGTAIIV